MTTHERVLSGTRETIRSRDGVGIATVTEGAGPSLLLVHGGMRSAASWAPLWPGLTNRYRVTALDRRGRGRSGDAPDYAPEREYDDITAVSATLAERFGAVDVLAHSIGAVFALGAAARGAPLRRLVLCEPPGPTTLRRAWLERATARIADGQSGRALVEFLVEIIGLDRAAVVALRDSPMAAEAVGTFVATFRREGEFLLALDPNELVRGVTGPVRFLLGDRSPTWAATMTRTLAQALPDAEVVVVRGHGHDLVDTAPGPVFDALRDGWEPSGSRPTVPTWP